MPIETTRPVFLNLLKIKLPIAGVMSIIHRVSGAVMFLATPALLYLFELSLAGDAGFQQAKALIHSPLFVLIFVGLLWGLLHHLFAGIRYLLIDIDIGVDKPIYRQTAWAVTIAAPVCALFIAGVIL